MLGISPFGMVHTVISLVAVAAGILAFVRYGKITTGNTTGQVYLWATIFTCLTGFFIFHHDGKFGPPHALGIITLVVLGIAVAGWKGKLGPASRYIEVLAYTLTFFFHMIPAFTETSTRLPVGHPWASSDKDPGLQMAIGIAFLVSLLGATWQFLKLWKSSQSPTASTLTQDCPAQTP